MTGKTGRHPVELVAEVQSMELNLDYSGAYKLQLKDGSIVRADFAAEQWSILEGMHNHGQHRIRIVGQGDYVDGRLQRIISIDLKKTQRVWLPEDPEEPTLLHIIKEIHKRYPQDAWDDVPTDLAQNMHHYLYGRPKVD